jgi:uncharacterized protein (UPF0332 family)/predicted nucleotidyltransferase
MSTAKKSNQANTRKPRIAREKAAVYRVAPRRGLTRQESARIRQFRTRLHQVLRDDQITSLILYGSKARGDARRDSDVDLLFVHRDLSPAQKETVEELTADLIGEKPEIHVLAYPLAEVAENAELGRPLFVNIAREGKLIEGEPLMVNETHKPKVSQEFFESAQRRLHAADALIKSEDYRDSISRSYYAVLDAADAALIAKGFTPRSHEGSLTLFGVHFIKKGLVDKEFGGLFHRMSEARKKADYNRLVTFSKDDAEYWFNLAKQFVGTIEKLLPTLLAEAN